MITSTLLASVISLCPLSLPQGAVDAGARPPAESLDGQLLRIGDLLGRVVEQDEDSVLVELIAYPGSRARVEKGALAPDRRFALREAQIDQKDAAAYLSLAEFAAEHDLYQRRMDALRRAAELDPSRREEIEKKLATARQECATQRIERAEKLREDGELHDAIEMLEETREHYADCEAGERVMDLLATWRENLEQQRAEAEKRREQRRELRQASEQLTEIHGLIEEGDEFVARARENGDDYVDAKRDYKRAIAYYRPAREELEEIGEHGQEPAGEEAARLMRGLNTKLVRAHVELGHVYVSRGDQHSANRHAGHAANLDPGSPSVAALRMAIAASRTSR